MTVVPKPTKKKRVMKIKILNRSAKDASSENLFLHRRSLNENFFYFEKNFQVIITNYFV